MTPTATVPEGALSLLSVQAPLPAAMLTAFGHSSGCTVDVVHAGDVRQALADLRQSPGGVDLVAVRADRARPMIDARLAGALDSGRITGVGDVADALRHPAATTIDGVDYGLAYIWQPSALLVRRDAFAGGLPTSWRVLYEPGQTGGIAVPDTPLQLAAAALYLGAGKPFDLSGDDLGAATRLVALQHGLRPRYWHSQTELMALFESGVVVAAAGPPEVATMLSRHGVPVVASIPAEGAMGFAESLLVTARAPHPDCAYRFLSYLLTPSAQAGLAMQTGQLPVTSSVCKVLAKARCTAVHAGDASYLSAVAIAQEPIAPTGYDTWRKDWRSVVR